jgi:polar amino acid transport system substrate-binding protein
MIKFHILIPTLCYLLPFFSFSAEQCKWNVGWEHFYPYSYQDKQGALVGIDIDILNIISTNLNCKITYIERPWQRLLMELKVGKIDIIAGVSRTKERETYSFYSQVYRYEEKTLFVRKEDIGKYSIKTISDLITSNIKLVVTRGHYNGKELEKARKNPEFNKRIFDVLDNRTHSKMLISNRADGYFDAKISGLQLLKEKNLSDKIVLHGFTLYKEPVFVIFSKKSFKHNNIESFNKEIIKLKKSGKDQQVIASYIK